MNKNLLLFFVTFMFSFAFVSCSKDNDNEKKEPIATEEPVAIEEPARYYVKYEVSFTTPHINPTRVVTFTTEKGTQTINLEQETKTVTWEGTYGPVDKGFKASLECSTPNYNYGGTIHGRIYVCREQEPFVIKAEGERSSPLLLDYSIDF